MATERQHMQKQKRTVFIFLREIKPPLITSAGYVVYFIYNDIMSDINVIKFIFHPAVNSEK